jgi:hypothetical protein
MTFWNLEEDWSVIQRLDAHRWSPGPDVQASVYDSVVDEIHANSRRWRLMRGRRPVSVWGHING